MLLYTASKRAQVQAAQIVRTWEMHGEIESLEGTFLHTRIELFINVMARPMETSKSSHMLVKQFLRETHPPQEYSVAAVMQTHCMVAGGRAFGSPFAQIFSNRDVWWERGIYRVPYMALNGATLDTSTGGVEPLQ